MDPAPGDRTAATIVSPMVADDAAVEIVHKLRQEFGSDCDIIMVAVPFGKGSGYMERLKVTLPPES